MNEYYIVFTQGVTHWITRWLKPNFSHIWILTRDKYNWIAINPTRGYLQHVILPAPTDYNPLEHMLKHGDTVVKIEYFRRNDIKQYGSIGLLNCVQWSKYILGLPIYAFTPWQLYRRLINFKAIDRLKYGIISIEEVSL